MIQLNEVKMRLIIKGKDFLVMAGEIRDATRKENGGSEEPPSVCKEGNFHRKVPNAYPVDSATPYMLWLKRTGWFGP